ncbi:hypothetical protein [Plantactinospora endophytica]|uniref:XRE family transcriptional regulator n=1 Tax=Plantactinospora endophytica TaxID=673535 RepID=A0ABQ4E871_9ACTN|nr:hypothetical protein [Plantactinospora endophytica]GIG90922.1 hypothetical protein Pen02_58580 [Plantactinospora endophytica]
MARERREPRTLLAHLIQQSDRTYEELAEEFSRFDPRAAISARHLGRLARGERDLSGATPATRRALQAMFGRPVDELQRPWAPENPSAIPEQRGTLALPGTGPERTILAMAAQRARNYAMLAAEATTPAAIQQLAEDVQRLALAYPQQPVNQLIGDLAETQDTLFTLLERRQPPNQSRDLHFLAGITSGLLAKVSHDLADPHAAMLQTRTAVLCAEQAGHPGLQAWLRGMQSLVAYWAGRYAEAVRYADAGREHATEAGGTTAVWLPASAARAYAALGNAEQAKAAITEAEQAWTRVRPDDLDAMGGICTFNQPRTLYYAADALAWLPDQATAAEDYATRAVTAYADPHDPAWAFGDQAGSHTDLAIARIAGRDLDAAIDALAPVLELPADQRINGIVHSVRRVHQAVSRAGLTADARDLVDGIEHFTHTPANALPR